MLYEEAVKVLFEGERIIAASQVVRSAPVFVGTCEAVRLLVKASEIGSPTTGDSVNVRPIFIDERGVEYLDANTTYGTFSLADTDTPCNVTVNIPYPTPVMALKITGAGSLSASTGFIVSARFVPIRKVMDR